MFGPYVDKRSQEPDRSGRFFAWECCPLFAGFERTPPFGGPLKNTSHPHSVPLVDLQPNDFPMPKTWKAIRLQTNRRPWGMGGSSFFRGVLLLFSL